MASGHYTKWSASGALLCNVTSPPPGSNQTAQLTKEKTRTDQ